MNLISFALLLLSNNLHLENMAEYAIKQEDKRLHLAFTIEYGKLLEYGPSEECDNRLLGFCTAKYLNDKMKVEVNSKPITFNLLESKTEGDHFTMLLMSKEAIGKIDNISIQNTCFFEYNRNFKNRVVFLLDSIQKSYLLTANSNSISFAI